METSVPVVFINTKSPLRIYSPTRNIGLNLFRARRMKELVGFKGPLKKKIDEEWVQKTEVDGLLRVKKGGK